MQVAHTFRWLKAHRSCKRAYHWQFAMKSAKSFENSVDALVNETQRLLRCRHSPQVTKKQGIISSSEHRSLNEAPKIWGLIAAQGLDRASSSALKTLLTVLPRTVLILYTPGKSNPDGDYALKAGRGLLIQAITEARCRWAEPSFSHNLALDTALSILRMARAELQPNNAIFDARGRTLLETPAQRYLHANTHCLYTSLVREGALCSLLRQVLSHPVASMEEVARSEQKAFAVRKRMAKLPWFFPKNFALLLDFVCDACVSVKLSDPNFVSGERLARSLSSFVDGVNCDDSVVIVLLWGFPSEHVTRCVRAVLFLLMNVDCLSKIAVEGTLFAIEIALDGIPRAHYYRLLQALRFTEARLLLRQEAFATQVRQMCTKLIVSLGQAAGKHVEEIPVEHRRGLMAIFRDMSHEHGAHWCDKLERVMLSSLRV